MHIRRLSARGVDSSRRRSPAVGITVGVTIATICLAACGNSSSTASGQQSSSSSSTSVSSGGSTSSGGGSSQNSSPPAGSKKVTITINTDLDSPVPGTNKTPYEFWIPAFEKAYPNIRVKAIASQSSSQDQSLYDRIVAALHAHKTPPVNITDSSILPQMIQQNAGVKITPSEVPLMKEVDPALVKATNDEAIPFRGSSVVLAYNSQYVKSPPHSLSQLLAWIKQHPGKFTYNTPGSGGSGEGFVQAVVTQNAPASQRSVFAGKYKASAESSWSNGFKTLAGLKKDIYHNGFYPDGNDPVLQLLANSSVWMAPVWSDQSTAALSDHDLPPYIKLAQVSPPFPGGPADLMVIKGTPNQKAAFDFVNYMLSPTEQALVAKDVSGYPGTEWKYAPKSVQKEFKGLASSYAPAWASQYTADLSQKWQNSVAAAK